MNFKYIELDQNSPKFRLTATKFMLVYQGVLFDKETFYEWFEDGLNMGVEWSRIAHEKHEIDVDVWKEATGIEPPEDQEPVDGKYKLYMSYFLVELNKKPDIKNINFFDYRDVRPKFLVIRKKIEFEKAKRFLALDQENSDLDKKEEKPYDLIAKCRTLDEAFRKFCTTPADAGGIKIMFEASRHGKPERFNYEPSFKWQMDFLREFDSENGNIPDSRRIVWVYDHMGNSGKTGLSKWLHINRPNEWISAKDLGTSRDSATFILNALNNGWRSHGITINLSRGSENHDRIYAYLEDIKDGNISTSKYVGQSRIFDHSFVIVFSNFLPHINLLSIDRWDIREITKDKDWVRLSVHDVIMKQKEMIMRIEESGYSHEMGESSTIPIVNSLRTEKIDPTST